MHVTLIILSILLLLLLWRHIGLAPRWAKKVFCVIGWHSPSRHWKITSFDGCSQHAQCPWCGYHGMIDSQGNLF